MDATAGDSSMNTDSIALAIFASRLEAICETMGARLKRAAFSPNIRDRLDYSCALFDANGGLLAQATHIPVHLGSMAWAMTGLARHCDWVAGDCLILNDPYRGGTHLPDITVIVPVFDRQRLIGFAANRAHHADIGSASAGSMPLSTHLEEEGVLIPPSHLYRGGTLDQALLESIIRPMARPELARADFRAQVAAARHGAESLSRLSAELGHETFEALKADLNDYAARIATHLLSELPRGRVEASDRLDDDGQGSRDIPINVTVELSATHFAVDFTGTAGQVAGNLNCPLSVTAAAVYYVFRCLLPGETPNCAGALAPVRIEAPAGCLVNARHPAAVAAGNVETSQRIVDVLLRALAELMPGRIPAASQGTMNNIAMGGRDWSYYETLAGGCGASREAPGRTAVHSHMTNTLNSPVEVLESLYPLRILRYAVRRDSGGAGRHRGGDGVIREYEFLDHADLCLLTERRHRGPWGLADGDDGRAGINLLDRKRQPAKFQCAVEAGQVLRVETPGGGGYG